jgi:hypothetical protein
VPPAKGEDRDQAQRPFLPRGEWNRTSVTSHGERAEELDEQHFDAWGRPVTSG